MKYKELPTSFNALGKMVHCRTTGRMAGESLTAWLDVQGGGIACWLEYRARDRKVASSNPGRNDGRIFFSRVNFVCRLLFGVRSTPVLPLWHVKDPGHSARNADGRLHLNRHTPLTQRSRSWWLCCPGIVWEFIRETSSCATRQGHSGPKSSQLTEPL